MASNVGAALAGQPVPPFHLPTHEFTQLFVLFASAVLVLGAWLAACRRPEEAREVLLLALASEVVVRASAVRTRKSRERSGVDLDQPKSPNMEAYGS